MKDCCCFPRQEVFCGRFIQSSSGTPSPNLIVQKGLPQSSPDEMFNWLKKQQNKQHDNNNNNNNNNKTNNLKYEPSAKTNTKLACIEKPMKNLALFRLRVSSTKGVVALLSVHLRGQGSKQESALKHPNASRDASSPFGKRL